jgi:AraC family transcriptional regulator
MPNPYEIRIMRVLDYIHDHPTGDLSLDRLADVAALSRFHFHRVFQAITGETAAQMVRRVRLHRAATDLVRSDAPSARIARNVGYPDISSFSRAFRDAYGQPPAAFRRAGELGLRPTLCQKGETTMFPITLRREPARRLGAMPHKGPYPEINRAFEKLGVLVSTRGLFAQAGPMVAVFYDDPLDTPAADLRSHAGLEFPESVQLDAPLEVVTLPAGRHAVLTFTGPYSGLPAAYDQLYRQWLPTSGETPADRPPFEIYLNSPKETAPEKLVTEVCLPLG